MKPILSFLIALLLASCAAQRPATTIVLPSTQEQCEAAGHRWGCRGVPGEGCPMICHAQTSDAGKTCKHSSECQGECVAVDEDAKSGTCSAHTTAFGCQFFLDDNRRAGDPALCYD